MEQADWVAGGFDSTPARRLHAGLTEIESFR
jgi:hypothetical protein